MPRGVRGTGPGARKRSQRDYPSGSDAYSRLDLTQEETRVVYESLRALEAPIGTRRGAVCANVLYRLTESVMSHETVQELNGKKPRRPYKKRAKKAT
jgi:hypothetical protein